GDLGRRLGRVSHLGGCRGWWRTLVTWGGSRFRCGRALCFGTHCFVSLSAGVSNFTVGAAAHRGCSGRHNLVDLVGPFAHLLVCELTRMEGDRGVASLRPPPELPLIISLGLRRLVLLRVVFRWHVVPGRAGQV